MRRFSISTLALTLTFLTVVAGTLAYKYWAVRDLHSDPRLGHLLRHQEKKISDGSASKAQIVLVGDSSLGNSVDARALSDLSGVPAVNLALTGSFGFAGGLIQLETLPKNRDITVLIMYSLDAMASGPLHDGHFFMTHNPFRKNIPPRQQASLLHIYTKRLLDGRSFMRFALSLTEERNLDFESHIATWDYAVSFGRINPDEHEYRLQKKVNRSSLIYLEQIADLCRAREWKCMYAHGPVSERALEKSPWASDYIAAANTLIEETGLPVIKTSPYAIPKTHIGDTPFHVHPDSRKEFTSYIARDLFRMKIVKSSSSD